MACNLLCPEMLADITFPRTALDAWRSENIRVAGAKFEVPGGRRIRLSVVAGNLRIHRLLTRLIEPGSTVIDVGANIGYNTVHAARCTGPRGRVIAVEPTADNLEVLRRNVASSGCANVRIEAVAAGSAAGARDLFVRGDRSAVNSFFAESCYAHVTQVIRVPVLPLDELVDGTASVVKIDVEGAELEVLEGMTRLLAAPHPALIVEWHPLLQRMAGFAPDALPHWLLQRGWRLQAASHVAIRALDEAGIPALTARLLRRRRPVELVAVRR